MAKIQLVKKTFQMFRRLHFWRGFIRRNKRATAVVLIVLVIFSSPYIYNLIHPTGAAAAWMDEAWAYREEIPVTSTNGSAQSNVVLTFSLDTATLITANKLQSACQDIRITDVGGNILPYHVGRTNACNASNTTIDFLLSNFPDGKSTYYVYYGNPQAVSRDAGAFAQAAAANYSVASLGTEANAPQALAYWKFDEGSGTSAHNSSSNSNTGTLTGSNLPTWQSDDLCISSKCLLFSGGASGSVTAAKTTNGVETVSFWVRPATSSAAMIDLNAGDASITSSSNTVSANNFSSPTIYVNGVVSSTLTTNQWNLVEVTTGTGITASAIKIGNVKGDYFVGSIDEVKLYGYARSAAQVQVDYNSRSVNGSGGGNTLGASTQVQQTTLSNGLVAYYKLDEPSGNSYDSSGNSYTLANNSLTPFNGGKYGNAPTYNGTTQYFSTTGTWAFVNENHGNTDTVNEPTNTAAGHLLILICIATAGTTFSPPSGFNSVNAVEVAAAQRMQMYYKIATRSEPSSYTCTNATQTEILAYSGISSNPVDTSNVNSATSGTTMTAPSVNTTAANDLVIRTYNTWNANSITNGPATQRINAGDGVGDTNYTSDENKATAGATGTATATQGTSAQWVAMTASFKSIPSQTISGVKTVSFWAKPTSTTTNFINLTSSAYITSSSGTVSGTGFTNSKVYVNGVLNGTITANTWNYIVVTTDTGINANQTEIGRANGAYNTGQIDEVRFYNRQLSTDDISTVYNWGPGPVGYWNFEEGTGTSANDTSGNSNTGTWSGTGSHWATGKYGKAGQFNAKNDNVSVPDSSSVEIGDGDFTISFWSYANSFPNCVTPFDKPNAATTHNEYIFELNCSGFEDIQIGDSGIINYNIPAARATKVWQYTTITRKGTTVNSYINGVVVDTDTQSGTVTSTDPLSIGDSTWDGKIDEFKIYNYARTPKQIISDMNAGHISVGSPIGSAVGQWHFDEGQGTTANNSGNCGTDCVGTLTNMASPATTVSGWQQDGKFSKALGFDGNNDFVSIANNPSELQITTDLTISAWINLTNTSSIHDIVAKKGASGQFGYRLHTDASGKLNFELSASGSNTRAATGSSTLVPNKWYYVTGVYSANNSLSVYVNGQQDGQVTTALPSSIFNSSANVNIGAENNGASNFFSGKIDEPKVYSGALTTSEIKLDMNQGKSIVFGALSDTSKLAGGSVASNSASAEYCVPGSSTSCNAPAGRWDFEEGTGITVNDTSGNSNNGTWAGTSSHWTQGKFGKAGNFGGTVGAGDFVDMGNSSTLDPTTAFTVSAWVKFNSFPSFSGTQASYIVSRGNNDATDGWFGIFESNQKAGIGMHNGGAFHNATGATTLTTGVWYHIEGTWDGTTEYIYLNGVQDGSNSYSATKTSLSANSEIGRLGKTNFEYYVDGAIDHVQLFNYARTQAQVAWDYNRGAPVAYYKMDECQGTTIHDSSGNNNTGTLTIGAGGSQSTVGTCSTPTDGTGAWYNGSVGKYNYSISLDGSGDDYIRVPDASSLELGNAGTMSVWYKKNVNGAYMALIAKGDGNGPQFHNYSIEWDAGTDSLTFQFGNGTTGDNFLSTNAYTDTTSWHHVVVTWDGTTVSFYHDGVLRDTFAQTIAYTTNNAQLHIGEFGGNVDYMNGLIDDVRLYNYPLTAVQVKTVYNQGAAVRFGPLTGSP